LAIASSVCVGGVIATIGDRAFAQSNIVPDDTLGAESSVVTPNFDDLPVEVIDGGAQRGANLRSREQSRPDAIELLVLSACETAEGDKRAALGLAGVAVRAGARSTLATLWQVNDSSTAELIAQFYKTLSNPGDSTVTKAKALQSAQLNLLRRYKAPLYWAPYVLVGNWL